MKCDNCKEKDAELIYSGVYTCRECLYNWWDDNMKESSFEEFIDFECKGFANSEVGE